MPETKEATLSDLLGEWAELEPVRCVQQQRAIGGSRKAVWVIDGEMITPLRSNKEAFIQAAVQEAIEERGWRWSVEDPGAKDYSHKADVFIDPVYHSPDNHHVAPGDSPARAILTAYLRALRSHA